MLLLGSSAEGDQPAASSADLPGDAWVSGVIDNLVLLASQDHGSASTAVGWYEEMMRLRRWLASDRFLADSEEEAEEEETTLPLLAAEATDEVASMAMKEDDDVHKVDDETQNTTIQEPDANSLVQNQPPWKNDGRRHRSRSRRAHQPRRRPSTAEQEQVDRDTNAHRPLRRQEGTPMPLSTESHYSARASAAASRGRSRHPAVRRTHEGDCNLGVHAWHVLLNMVSALEAPAEPEYGLLPTQHDNIRARSAT